jgi:hypothetical protein
LASRITGTCGFHVPHQLLQLVFGAVGREIGDLRLEGNHGVGRGLDDGGTEIVDARGIALHAGGKFRGIGVEADAEQGLVLALCRAQHVEKGHALILRTP